MTKLVGGGSCVASPRHPQCRAIACCRLTTAAKSPPTPGGHLLRRNVVLEFLALFAEVAKWKSRRLLLFRFNPLPPPFLRCTDAVGETVAWTLTWLSCSHSSVFRCAGHLCILVLKFRSFWALIIILRILLSRNLIAY